MVSQKTFRKTLEIKFMSPLDNDAAKARDKIAVDQPLDADERMAWARFMLSLLYRNRERLSKCARSCALSTNGSIGRPLTCIRHKRSPPRFRALL
jgi:hypothetical protein